MKQTIKKLMLSFLALLMAGTLAAQVPQLFNYQGIARDKSGNPLKNQQMTIRLSVLPGADATEAEYEEVQTISTNEFGLYSLQIGNGHPLKSSMKSVKWETGNKYIQVAIDVTGGSNFSSMGTNQLLSVPYAIYADRAGSAPQNGHDKTRSGNVSTDAAGTGTINYLTKFTASNTIYNSQIFDNGTNVGIGTTSPASKLHLLTTNGNVEHIRMQNTNSAGFGKFLMHNDIASNYATFTKYGSAFPGGYPGIASQFPYANMLAFGNNLGPFMLANNGNVGIGIVSNGTTVLKFNAQQGSGYIGIGGSAVPAANVHLNHSSTGDTLMITNATTGHTAADGLNIATTGNTATIMNKENSTLTLGTNNTPIVNLTAAGNTELAGQIKISGGAPGAGKVLTSDANGLASWATPVAGNIGGAGGANSLAKFTGANTIGNSIIFDNGTNVGINNVLPHAPLQFANAVGNRKAVLYEVQDNDHQFFGLGINSGIMRYQVGDVVNSHVFYAGFNATTSNELMRVQGNGNVGIGTATPGAKLEVAGQVKITGGTPGAGKVLTSDASGLASWVTPNGVTGTGTVNYVPRFITANSIGNGAMYDNGTNVGIGTATPHAPLQFSNAQANRKIVLAENADNDHSFYGFGINAGLIRYQVGAPGGNHVFYSAINGTSSKELMRIQGNGNVGIGTDTANAALQFGNVAANRRIVLYENANNDHEFYGIGINSAAVRYQVGNTSSSHIFYAATGAAASTEILRMQGDGNVGIGNSTPHAQLQFGNTVANRKMVLYENFNNDHQYFGLGINTGILRYQVGSTANSHVFYAGVNPLSSTELMRILGSGRVGIGTSIPGGQFELSLDQGRKPSTSTWTITSDARLKNINGSYKKGLNEILQLNPITYQYKNVENRKFSDKVLETQNIGFSAQEVQQIFPEAVGTDDDGYLNLNIHPILVTYVNAIKELNEKAEQQQKQIEEQQKINNELIKRLEALEKK